MNNILRSEKGEGIRVILTLLVVAPLSFLPSLLWASSLSDQASQAWAKREAPGQMEEAINLWKEAAKAEPENAEHRIQLTKALGRAVRHAISSKEQRKWADEARASAEKAVELAPKSSQAYAYLGEALGQWADARKNIRSLSAVKKAVAALKKAIELNPENAYAHMLLAEFYRQSPAVVSVGDKTKALEEARLAAKYGPTYAINHLVLARSLLEQGKREEAISELRAILVLTPPADAVPETHADQATAKQMLDMLVSGSSNSSCDQSTSACTEHP